MGIDYSLSCHPVRISLSSSSMRDSQSIIYEHLNKKSRGRGNGKQGVRKDTGWIEGSSSAKDD